MNGPFEFTLRVYRCPNCMAPVEVPVGGGQLSCTYCSAPISVSARTSAAAVDPAIARLSEDDRLHSLAAQAASNQPVAGLYDLENVPSKYGFLAAERYGEKLRSTLETEWNQARGRLAADPAPEHEHDLFFLTFHLNKCLFYLNEPSARRATLESAFEALPDRGHKHIVATQLTRASIGDTNNAMQWLSLADPRPENLWFDSEYRLAHAAILAEQGRWQDVLDTVGNTSGDIPFYTQSAAAAVFARIAARAALGQAARARQELQGLILHEPQRGWVASHFVGKAPADMNATLRRVHSVHMHIARRSKVRVIGLIIAALTALAALLNYLLFAR